MKVWILAKTGDISVTRRIVQATRPNQDGWFVIESYQESECPPCNGDPAYVWNEWARRRGHT